MWVGGVGWSQTFINHCFMIYLTIILGPKNCANPKSQISQNLWDGQVCSQVWANMRALEFFLLNTYLFMDTVFFMFGGGVGDQNSSSRNTEIVLCTKGSKQCIAMRQ